MILPLCFFLIYLISLIRFYPYKQIIKNIFLYCLQYTIVCSCVCVCVFNIVRMKKQPQTYGDEEEFGNYGQDDDEDYDIIAEELESKKAANKQVTNG